MGEEIAVNSHSSSSAAWLLAEISLAVVREVKRI